MEVILALNSSNHRGKPDVLVSSSPQNKVDDHHHHHHYITEASGQHHLGLNPHYNKRDSWTGLIANRTCPGDSKPSSNLSSSDGTDNSKQHGPDSLIVSFLSTFLSLFPIPQTGPITGVRRQKAQCNFAKLQRFVLLRYTVFGLVCKGHIV